jgi:hypothetical protein
MDEQPDILSSGPRPRPRHGDWWPAVGPRGRIATAAVCILLACLGVITCLALLVAHRDGTITDLRTALRNARHPAPVTAAGPPAASGSALFSLPDAALGSFSVVAVAVRPSPGATALTWLFVYGQHAGPGQHYGLLEGTCGGQYVTATDLADGTADRRGDLTIAAHDLGVSSQAPDYWVMLYRWDDGAPLGGVQGPLIGGGARTFRAAPPC